MRRKALFAAGLAVLLFAGVATAAVLTRKVTLRSGACVTISKTRVCAAKAKVRLVPGPTVTVTTPAPPPVTVTVTTTTAAPPPPPPTSPVTEDFSGTGTSGNQDLATFSTPVAETLTWTSSWPSGCDIGECNGAIGIFDFGTPSETLVDVTNVASGSVTLPAGSHALTVVDDAGSTWTIHVG